MMDDAPVTTLPTTSKGRVRPMTFSRTRGRKPGPVHYPLNVIRPLRRADCEGGVRPCPWVSCRHHLYLDVVRNGSMKLNFPHLEPWELEETCSLDVAAWGSKNLEEVGDLMNITRERTRQIEAMSLRELQRALQHWRETA